MENNNRYNWIFGVIIAWGMMIGMFFFMRQDADKRAVLKERGVRVEATLVSSETDKRSTRSKTRDHILLLDYGVHQRTFTLDDSTYKAYFKAAEYHNIVVYDPETPAVAMLAYDFDHPSYVVQIAIYGFGILVGVFLPIKMLVSFLMDGGSRKNKPINFG